MSNSRLLRVFVYGTLKRGEPNHYWLTDAGKGFSRLVSIGKTQKKYPLVIGTRYNIPFLLDKEGTGHNVEGEIYEIDDKMLSSLDDLEEYPNYYDREIQDIVAENGSTTQCWIYLLRKFPENMLSKEFLQSYRNTPEKPYCESYLQIGNQS
ncbi:unnamed protein product [Hermetia illucens]|uniref:Gamma-glutamylcyclotransferase family protein n=1 Tax=Hermetia illucens TaxID=343691 RepID=A0A7R8YKP4_HERIL|nr:unnamed protein product [Hermetia illucens]